MLWQTKSAKNSEKSGDFTAFLIETALIYENRFPADGAFLELAARLDLLPEQKRNERYAKRAFRNTRIAIQKQEAKRRKYETEFSEAIPGAADPEANPDILAALEMLTEYEHTFIELRFFCGYSAREIAGIFGISRQAATRRIKQTLDKLKTLL